MEIKTILKKATLLILLLTIIIMAMFLTVNSKVSANINGVITLQPHHAKYKLKMVSKSSNIPLSDLSGDMQYNIDDGCDGWSTSQKFILTYSYNNQRSTTEEKIFSNWEAKDGNYFQFASKTISDNFVKEELRGSAEKEKNGEGIASFTRPEGVEFTLNKNTVFPSKYVVELLKHAKKGDKFFNKFMFDGADTNGILEVNSFIGRKIPVSDLTEIYNNPDIDKKLLGKYAWNIRVAFFKLHTQEETPSYEIDIVLHDNGVVSSTIITYKNFTVKEYITSLSARENKCN